MQNRFKGIKSFYTVLLILICIQNLYSQDITNIRFEQEGKKVNIYYDITGSKSGQKFDIKVYCYDDGGQTWGNPLRSVSGAVGINQISGYEKKIIWNVLADREKLTEDVKFRIKAIMADGFEGSSGIFSDSRDGKTYKWVRIGTQIWMAENLNYYTSTGSWCYDNRKLNCNICGRLYNWKVAKNICPIGWHLPSFFDWKYIENKLNLNENASHTNNNFGDMVNKSGGILFKPLQCGNRNSDNSFDNYGVITFWGNRPFFTYKWAFGYGGFTTKNVDNMVNNIAHSVRCVKD